MFGWRKRVSELEGQVDMLKEVLDIRDDTVLYYGSDRLKAIEDYLGIKLKECKCKVHAVKIKRRNKYGKD